MDPSLHRDVDGALFAYWTARDEAAAQQAARGAVDVGGRAGATSGGHLDRVAQLLARACIQAGAPNSAVFFKAPKDDIAATREGAAVGFTLPGYYRPTKQWDLVVYDRERSPLAIVELKSQNGPSYGNNANNRAEEAIGNAHDFIRAKAANLIPGDPWTGYVFVIEDDIASRLSRGQRDRGFFEKDTIFADWSYVDRVRLLCERLVADGLYDGTWAVATSRPNCPGPKDCPQLKLAAPGKRKQVPANLPPHQHQFSWAELDPPISGYEQFIKALTQRVQAHYPATTDRAEIVITNPPYLF